MTAANDDRELQLEIFASLVVVAVVVVVAAAAAAAAVAEAVAEQAVGVDQNA